MVKKPSIVSFGEVLWDVFPDKKIEGGAPMNFLCHAKNLGCDVQIISAIGNDTLGEELLAFLAGKGIQTDFVQTNYTFPTSTVKVQLNEKGIANYEINQSVAWDYIHLDEAKIDTVEKADIFLFGSLIAREQYSRNTLFKLIEKAQKTVFDVNLRAPFYSQLLLEPLLDKADILKVNDQELDIITGWYGMKGNILAQMELLVERFKIETLVMTKGKYGAFCLHDNEFISQKGFPVEVQDTIGAGDAFLAAFVAQTLHGKSKKDCLEFACAAGAIVATKSGGTPEINETIINTFLKERKAYHQ